jgi:ankyrin repeat protein
MSFEVFATPNDDLLQATNRGDIEAVRKALEQGADVNTRISEGAGKTAPVLVIAAAGRHVEIVNLLLERGADVNAKVTEGRGKDSTALMVALSNGNANLVKLLLEHGADTNAKNIGGMTILMIAAQVGDAEIIKLLMEHGADVNAKVTEGQSQGWTALAVAEWQNHPDIVDLLLKAGANWDEGQKRAVQWIKVSSTAADMRMIGTALILYQTDFKNFPLSPSEKDLSENELSSKYWIGTFTDAWGIPFRYISDGQSYTLTSFGADKASGNGNTEFDSDIVFLKGQFVAPASVIKK